MRNKILCFALMWAALVIAVSGQNVAFDSASPVVPSSVSVIYDPHSSTNTVLTQIAVNAVLDSGNNVNYYYTIDGPQPEISSRKLLLLGNTSSYITCKFYKDTNYTQEILYGDGSGLSQSQVLNGRFKGNRNRDTLYFTPVILMNQAARVGTYSQTFTINLYQGLIGSSAILRGSTTFTVFATVSATTDVRVGPATGSYDTGLASYNINLGEVSGGTTGTFAIFVKATTAYTLTMTCASGGYLTSSTTTDKIPYFLKLDNNTVTLGIDVPIDQQTSAAVYNRVILGEIIVPSGQDVEAGQYSDIVSFSVVAN